jgi:hypothetical protein
MPCGLYLTPIIGVWTPIGSDAKGTDRVPALGGGELGICAEIAQDKDCVDGAHMTSGLDETVTIEQA